MPQICFPVDGKVANFWRTCCHQVVVVEFGKRHNRHKGLLLTPCYRETCVMDFGHKLLEHDKVDSWTDRQTRYPVLLSPWVQWTPISRSVHSHNASVRTSYLLTRLNSVNWSRDVTELAKIHIRRMRISCAKSVGCRCGFVVQSKLLVIVGFVATVIQVIQLSYLKLSNCKQTSSEQLK